MESRIDFKSGKWPTTVTSHDVIGPYIESRFRQTRSFNLTTVSSRKKQSEAQLFSCFGESKVSPFFQWHLGTKTPRWERLGVDWGYVRDHDSHLGMCLGHLLAKYGCSSAYSFPVILIQLGRGHFRQNFTEIQIL